MSSQSELKFEGGTHAASGGKTRPPKYGGSHQSYDDEARGSDGARSQHDALEGSQPSRGTGSDVTGVTLGTFTVKEVTDWHDAHNSRMCELRCACNRSKFMPVTEVRRYQSTGRVPSCNCETYRDFIAARALTYVRRCGLCKAVDHALATCPKRKPAKWCGTCAGLQHRVTGIKCRECGLRFRREPPVELKTPSLSSPAARCLDFAMGTDTDDRRNRRPSKRRVA